MQSDSGQAAPERTDSLNVLVASHDAFLGFLEKRLPSREIAEDILQDAFVRAIDRVDSVRRGESVTAWFYRMLRNAIIDHHRRNDTAARALDRLAAEVEPHVPPAEWEAVACRCALDLAGSLKAEYADAIRRIDVAGMSVSDYAREMRISAGSAGVRVHRARRALRSQVERACRTCATHGCMDCTCSDSMPQSAGSSPISTFR